MKYQDNSNNKKRKENRTSLKKDLNTKKIENADSFIEGSIIEIAGNICKVKTDSNIIKCQIRGSLKKIETNFSNIVAVGDNVAISIDDTNFGMIEKINPRKGILARQDVSKKGKSIGLQQIIAANVDQLLIVASWKMPVFWPELVDRYLVTAFRNKIKPILCINKIDLVKNQNEVDKVISIYESIGVAVLQTSVSENIGIEKLQKTLLNSITVLAGLSGVGKSSLLNAIQPGLALKALPIGTKGTNRNQGQHTTTMATMYTLTDGGAVIDTPGIRNFGLAGLSKIELANFYPEMDEFNEDCKYRDCLHIDEPDCAIRKRVANRQISKSRYAGYQKILKGI